MHLLSVEASARAQVTKMNRVRLRDFLFHCCSDAKPLVKLLVRVISKAALLSSFTARNMDEPPPMAYQMIRSFFYRHLLCSVV